MSRSALLLGLFALVGTAIVAVVFTGTEEPIAAAERTYMLRSLHSVIKPELHDNDIFTDHIEVHSLDYLGTDKARNFTRLLTLWSAADSYLFCVFAVAPTRILSLADMADVLHNVTGWETSSYEIMAAGRRRLHLMRWYNDREGLTGADDTLPDRFFEEAIRTGPRAGDRLDRVAFQSAIKDVYGLMGWDENGKPSTYTMYDSHLEEVSGLGQQDRR